jgi:hypothetical protein
VSKGSYHYNNNTKEQTPPPFKPILRMEMKEVKTPYTILIEAQHLLGTLGMDHIMYELTRRAVGSEMTYYDDLLDILGDYVELELY